MTDQLKIGQEVLIHGYVDEIRKDTIIIQNEGGYFGTVEYEITDIEMPNTNDVLDKIRAEIIKYEGDCRLSVDEYPSCKQCTDNTFKTIYAILDKYKAESIGGTQHDD